MIIHILIIEHDNSVRCHQTTRMDISLLKLVFVENEYAFSELLYKISPGNENYHKFTKTSVFRKWVRFFAANCRTFCVFSKSAPMFKHEITGRILL